MTFRELFNQAKVNTNKIVDNERYIESFKARCILSEELNKLIKPLEKDMKWPYLTVDRHSSCFWSITPAMNFSMNLKIRCKRMNTTDGRGTLNFIQSIQLDDKSLMDRDVVEYVNDLYDNGPKAYLQKAYDKDMKKIAKQYKELINTAIKYNDKLSNMSARERQMINELIKQGKAIS